jgi:tetratricopeptide (TPR) repeat protein
MTVERSLVIIAIMTLGGGCALADPSAAPSPAAPTSNPAVLNTLPSPPAVADTATIAPSPSIIAPDPAEAARLRQQGLAKRQAGDLDGAIADFQQAAAHDPDNLDGQVLWGWTLHLAGREAEAAQVLVTVGDRDPDFVPALNALGIVYLFQGDLARAIATHTHAATLDPQNEIAAYNLSLAYHRQQNWPEAIAQATRATELEPNNPHPWLALAIAQQGAGNLDAAQVARDRALTLNGTYRNLDTAQNVLTYAGFSPDQQAALRQLMP